MRALIVPFANKMLSMKLKNKLCFPKVYQTCRENGQNMIRLAETAQFISREVNFNLIKLTHRKI